MHDEELRLSGSHDGACFPPFLNAARKATRVGCDDAVEERDAGFAIHIGGTGARFAFKRSQAYFISIQTNVSITAGPGLPWLGDCGFPPGIVDDLVEAISCPGIHHSDLREAISIEKRYFTSDFSNLS